MCFIFQIKHYRNNPPSQTCLRAITELIERSHKIHENNGLLGPHFISLSEKISEINLKKALNEMLKKKSTIDSFNLQAEIPDFESQVIVIRVSHPVFLFTQFLNCLFSLKL